MAIHSPQLVERWENRLKEDSNELLTALAGRVLTAEEVRMHELPDEKEHRRVNASEIRWLVDRLSADLKEIGRLFGKG